MLIRQENHKDFNEVYELVYGAFKTAEHTDGNEQNLVVSLRKSAAFIPQLSLVAEVDGKILGHIMLTNAEVGGSKVLVLAPLSVLPEYQRKGIGGALIKEGHRIAKELGYGYCLVLGSAQYYPRFGYLPAEQFGVDLPAGIPSENFMAIKFNGNIKLIKGSVKYAKEFDI